MSANEVKSYNCGLKRGMFAGFGLALLGVVLMLTIVVYPVESELAADPEQQCYWLFCAE